MTLDDAKALKMNIHATFESPQGQETMKFIEKIGSWYPSIKDSNETNSIIARDANRKLIATLKTILNLTPEQMVYITED